MRDSEAVILDVFVASEPAQVGSKTAFPVYRHEEGHGRSRRRPQRRDGGVVVCESCGDTDGPIIINVADQNDKAVQRFRKAVDAALVDHVGAVEHDGAFELRCDFYLRRPESHYGTGRNAHLVKDSAPARPTSFPDADKLLRSAQDALRDTVWKNDSQVVGTHGEKWYAVPTDDGDGVGVRIRVRRADQQHATDLPPERRVRVLPTRESPPDDGDQQSLLAAA